MVNNEPRIIHSDSDGAIEITETLSKLSEAAKSLGNKLIEFRISIHPDSDEAAESLGGLKEFLGELIEATQSFGNKLIEFRIKHPDSDEANEAAKSLNELIKFLGESIDFLRVCEWHDALDRLNGSIGGLNESLSELTEAVEGVEKKIKGVRNRFAPHSASDMF